MIPQESRSFKFRAWDKEEKIMLKWYDHREFILDAIPWDGGDEWSERCVVMQYTGWQDKNGREIYEYDIITFYANALNGQRTFVVRHPGFRWHLAGAWDFPPMHKEDTLEVIGNIYENPELVEPWMLEY